LRTSIGAFFHAALPQQNADDERRGTHQLKKSDVRFSAASLTNTEWYARASPEKVNFWLTSDEIEAVENLKGFAFTFPDLAASENELQPRFIELLQDLRTRANPAPKTTMTVIDIHSQHAPLSTRSQACSATRRCIPLQLGCPPRGRPLHRRGRVQEGHRRVQRRQQN
jgi:hypothetical protein